MNEYIDENFDTPYEVKIFNVDIDRDKCLSSISENTIQFVEQKIKYYKDKIDSENILRAYAKKEHQTNQEKAKGYAIAAIIIIIIANVIFWEANLGDYLSIYSFSISNLSSVSALLIYPLFIVLLIGTVICMVKAVKLQKNANIILDSYGMKNKDWNLVIAESRERDRIYKEEIERLEKLCQEMKDEREQMKENLRRIEAEKNQ